MWKIDALAFSQTAVWPWSSGTVQGTTTQSPAGPLQTMPPLLIELTEKGVTGMWLLELFEKVPEKSSGHTFPGFPTPFLKKFCKLCKCWGTMRGLGKSICSA